MAYTVKGKRVAFDNIAYASVTGRESKCAGVSTTPATTDGTTPYANQENVKAPAGTSGYEAQGREHTLRTVSGNATTDFTTDRAH